MSRLQFFYAPYPGGKYKFPNRQDPVPLHFSMGPFSLVGRQSLLDHCIATFDGPRKIVTLDF